MRPSAFTVASRAASISGEVCDVHRDGFDPPLRFEFCGGAVGQLAVAVPDRDRSRPIAKSARR